MNQQSNQFFPTIRPLWALWGAVFLISCPGTMVFYAPTPQGQVARGKQLFESQGLGAVPYSCMDCHIELPEDAQNPSLKVGHSLYNVASRGSWYGGKYKTRAVQGAKDCLTNRMKAPELPEDDVEALQGYLQSLSPARKVPPLSESGTKANSATLSTEELEWAAKNLGIEGQGNALVIRGRALFQAACENCHNEERKIAPVAKKLVLSSEELRILVRKGAGTMPPFAEDRISNDDIAAISAYLTWLTPPLPNNEPTTTPLY